MRATQPLIYRLRGMLYVGLGSATLIAFFLSAALAAWNTMRLQLRAQATEAALFSQRVGDHYATTRAEIRGLLASLILAPSRVDAEVEMTKSLRSNLSIAALRFLSPTGIHVEVGRTGRQPVDEAPLNLIVDCNGANMAWMLSDVWEGKNGESFAEFCLGTAGKGVVSGRISIKRMSEILAEMRNAGAVRAAIVDRSDRIIAHSDLIPALLRRTLEPASVSPKLVAGAFLLSDAISVLDIAKFSLRASAPIPGTNWRAVLERDLNEVFAPLRGVAFGLMSALAVSALIAVFLVSKLSKLLSMPVIALTKSVRARSLHLAFGGSSSGVSEVDELADAFRSTLLENERHRVDLELRIADKTRSLQDLNSELQSSSRHKSEFLAHMSHELRTPLNAVIGFSDLLKAQYFGPLNQKQSEYVRDINASGQHLLSLINDILDLAKVEAGRMELVLSDCHVATLVESCVSLVSERVSRSQQTLTADVSSDVGTWPLDERKVKQCLLNLLTNASKFTPGGGAITLRVFVDNNELVAAVSDNGVGIAADDLSKLFSEFYQAKTADDSSGVAAQREGTGLGLALTKGFVELHGGTISVESVAGKGSTFTMRFPGPADSGVDEAELAHADKLESAK